MSGAPPTAMIALAVCVLVAVACLAVFKAFAPRTPARVVPASSTPTVLSGLPRGRVAAGAVVVFVTLLATRWVLLSLVAGVLTALWGRLLHDRRADLERTRVEAIARWLEDLRDTLRGSSIAAEEALEVVATRPPQAIAAALHTFALRRRQGFRTEDALADLADDLAHPISDAAISAIVLVIGGSAGAGRLYGTVNALAAAARGEVTARERIDRTRAVYQSSMKHLVVIGVILVVYLRFAAGDLLDPYSTPAGQVVLALPLAMWGGCIMWLRSLCRYELPQRYRIVTTDSSSR